MRERWRRVPHNGRIALVLPILSYLATGLADSERGTWDSWGAYGIGVAVGLMVLAWGLLRPSRLGWVLAVIWVAGWVIGDVVGSVLSTPLFALAFGLDVVLLGLLLSPSVRQLVRRTRKDRRPRVGKTPIQWWQRAAVTVLAMFVGGICVGMAVDAVYRVAAGVPYTDNSPEHANAGAAGFVVGIAGGLTFGLRWRRRPSRSDASASVPSEG